MSCSCISSHKQAGYRALHRFVDPFIAAFCCSLWTSCRQTGLQSTCASNHRKHVDKNICLAVGRHGRHVSDAIVVFHIVLIIWQRHSLSYPLPFVSSSRIFHLESSIRTACFLFFCTQMPFTLYAQTFTSYTRSLLTMHTCYDELSPSG